MGSFEALVWAPGQTRGSRISGYLGLEMGSAVEVAAAPSLAPEPPEPVDAGDREEESCRGIILYKEMLVHYNRLIVSSILTS